MARLPSIKRILAEDFKDQPWIGKLLQPLNQFMSEAVEALSGGLNSDNFTAQQKRLKVKVNANTYPLYFRWSQNSQPNGLWVVQAKEDAGSPEIITSPVWADWDFVIKDGTGQIRVNNITGLTSGKTYFVTLWAWNNPES